MKQRAWAVVFLLLAGVGLCPVVAFSQPEGSLPATGGEPLALYMSIVLMDVDDVNAAEHNFSANVFYRARWTDPRLRHDGPGAIQRPIDEIWHPQIQVVNQQRFFPSMQETAWITPEGKVAYQQRVWGSFSQSMELSDFPMDRQAFQILLTSSQDVNGELIMLADPEFPSRMSPELSLPDWDVLDWTAGDTVYKIVPEAKGVSAFEFRFVARRQFGYYFYKVIVPFFLVAAMSCTVFWIPPVQSETQISVTITSMLTLIAFRLTVGDMLPRISYYTRMDHFIFITTVIVFLTIIQSVWTSRLAYHGKAAFAEKVDRWCRWIFPIVYFLYSGWIFLPLYSGSY